MADFKFDFANPVNHADWAKYAGFNRTTGALAPVASPSLSGIKPPESMSQMWEEETKPISEAWSSAKQFGTQVLGGNFGGSFNSAINPNEQTTSPTEAPITNPYNYKSQLDDEELSQGLDNLDGMDFISAMA